MNTWQEYVPLANRTAKELPFQKQLWHARMGFITEIGELVDLYKRHYIYGKPFDTVNFREEIGDLAWYIALECQTRKFNLDLASGVLLQQGALEDLEERFLKDLSGRAGHLCHSASTVIGLELMLNCMQQLCMLRGVDFYQCLRLNIAKLAKRYGDKYSDNAALVRDLIAERELLEAA